MKPGKEWLVTESHVIFQVEWIRTAHVLKCLLSTLPLLQLQHKKGKVNPVTCLLLLSRPLSKQSCSPPPLSPTPSCHYTVLSLTNHIPKWWWISSSMHASETPRGVVKTQNAGLHLQLLIQVGLGWAGKYAFWTSPHVMHWFGHNILRTSPKRLPTFCSCRVKSRSDAWY